ncbi:MAG: dienelactone hydrolase family protein [Gemmatimonadaceae bacterium]
MRLAPTRVAVVMKRMVVRGTGIAHGSKVGQDELNLKLSTRLTVFPYTGVRPILYPIARRDVALIHVLLLECFMSVRRAVTGVVLAGAVSACHRSMPADEHMAHMAAGDMASPPATASSSQGDLSLPPSAKTAAARLAASPRHGEWVTVAWEPGSKDSLMAYIVYPSTTRAHTPVVVVVHEIFGLSTWVRGVADQVAAEGFIAIAPDLLSKVRGGPSSVELPDTMATRLIRGVSNADKNAGIDAVATYAMSQPSAEQKYSVIGYCWGGSTVWTHAINGGVKGFSGGVAFYGLPYMTAAAPGTPAVPMVDSLKKITKPVMLLSGSKDPRIGAGMPAVDSMMKALGKNYYGMNYPGAVHGFLRAQDDPKATRDEAEEQANLAATKDGWPKTVAFLKKNLGLK